MLITLAQHVQHHMIPALQQFVLQPCQQLTEAVHQLVSETTARTCGETVQRSPDSDK